MTIAFPGRSRVDARLDGFVIRTDQSVDAGGEGSAPAPFDLFLASLGTCSAYYVLRFLRQRALPLDDVAVTLRAEWEPDHKRLSGVAIRVTLPAGFPEKYRQAVLRAVDQCPVKRHLREPPPIRTELHVPTADATARG